jgi:transposase-like protein
MVTPVEPAERERRLTALREELGAGRTMASAARRLGMKPNSLHSWVLQHPGLLDTIKRGEPETPPPIPPVAAPVQADPREVRDAAFWRAKAVAAERARDEAESLVQHLAGLREVPVLPESWELRPDSNASRSIIIAHTSDLHIGECIDPGEVQGLNAYSTAIARDRMRRYFETVCTIGPRWLHGSPCDGALLTMGGDLISGDIHDELSRTNDLTSHDQVAAVVEVYAAGIEMLLQTFGAVHVVAVPGNHGRTTVKPTAKLAAKLSYDILAASMLKARITDARVTWQIADGIDVRTPVYGRTIVTTHGDRMGTGGGMGFAGPELPILRGAHKMRLQSFSAAMACDLILSGHYHTSTNLRGVLANGSVPGYSEYGNGLRAALEPPQQWMARFSMGWGLCERLAVQLGEGKARMRAKRAA